jgi:dihydrofolate reductase
MRELILKMSVSVDGFVAGPNGEIDWIFRTSDERATAWTVEAVSEAGVHIMGSSTYYDMAAYWPTSTEPFAPPMNEIPKAIFSRRGLEKDPKAAATTKALEDARENAKRTGHSAKAVASNIESWAHPRVASGDLTEEIRKLKNEPGKPILAHGGASFAQSLTRAGLVDEYKLMIHPVALGKGLGLFAELTKPVDLKLVEAIPFPGGGVAHIYRP